MIFDGLAFLKEYRIAFSDSGKNIGRGWVGINCPFCGDNENHMGFNPAWGTFSCWRNHACPTIGTIERLAHVSSDEARRIYRSYLVEKAGGFRASSVSRRTKGETIDLPPATFNSMEKAYLTKRGLFHDTILQTYQLRGGGYTGEWAFRIVIPIIYEGRVVSASGRAIYKNPEIPYKTLAFERQVIDLKTIFLGLDLVADNMVAVVEGHLDAVKGGPGFISSFGAKLKDEQLDRLKMYRKVYWCFDMDQTGRDNAYKYSAYLAAIGVDSEVISWDFKKEDGSLCKDIGDMSRGQINELRSALGFRYWEVN